MPSHISDDVNALAPNPYPHEKYIIASAHTDRKSSVHVELVPDLPEILAKLSLEERQTMERKLVRKIDIRLLPMLVLMYILNYLDRNNIASAKLAGKVGLVKDLGLTSTQYNVGMLIRTLQKSDG